MRTVAIETGRRPLVSVVMCTYNVLGRVQSAVNDIIEQTFKDWELVISDDGSTDGTRQWLERLPTDSRIRVFYQKQNVGYIRNKNFAIAQARGAFITQQDADDRCTPDRLERQLSALERTGEKICGCGYERIDWRGEHTYAVSPSSEITLKKGPYQGPYPFWFPSLMFSRSVLDTTGNFPDYFSGAFGDDHYWTMLANERYSIVCLPQVMYSLTESRFSVTTTLNNRRKLIITHVLDMLIDSRRRTGSDPLADGRIEVLREYEQALMANRRLIAEQLRVFAVRCIDQNRLQEGRQLLAQAVTTFPFLPNHARTVAYLLRELARENTKRGQAAPPKHPARG